ncbi:MAG: GAF domain-containing protein [Chloroflexi bacterium]|nr:GAF domain-containing protein [Chloroflexota bacterium]
MDRPIVTNAYASPRRLFALTTVTIFVFEAFIMVLLSILPPFPNVVQVFFDASLLSVMTAITLYFFLYRPLMIQNSERRRAEELADEKRRHADELKAIFNAITDMVIVTDKDGKPIQANPAVIAAFGFNPTETPRTTILQQISTHHSDGRPMEPEELPSRRALRGETVEGERMLFTNVSGRTQTILVSASPLWTEGKVSGTVTVARDITQLEKLTAELRAALVEWQRRQAEVAALLTAARALLEHREFNAASREIFHACKQLIGAQVGYVAVLAENRREAVDAYMDPGEQGCGVDPTQAMPIRGMREQVCLTGRALFDNDFSASEFAALVPPGHSPLENVLFAPLTLGDQVVGVIGLGNKPGGFNAHDAQIATAFGELAVIALQNSKNLDALHQARAHLETRVEERTAELAESYRAESAARRVAETLYIANLALTQSLDLDTVLETLLDYLVRLVPYDSANVMLFESETRLAVRATRGYAGLSSVSQVRALTFDTSANPILRELVEKRRGVLVADTTTAVGWEHKPGVEFVQSWIGIPLVAGGKVIGLFSLDKAAPGFFNDEYVRLAEALAPQAAVAIQNAWLFEQVRAGRERLQMLSRQLVQVQESERLSIARELHDETSQTLTSLMVDLRLLEQGADDAPATRARIAEIKATTDTVLENLHRLAADLRPASLDHLGLVAALRQHVEMLNHKHATRILFETVGVENLHLKLSVATALYRVAQEGLANALRHARATQIDLLLERRRNVVVLVVEDNGVGFDIDEAMERGRLGLLGMKERVEMLDGVFTLEGRVGKGTTIYVEVSYADSSVGRG